MRIAPFVVSAASDSTQDSNNIMYTEGDELLVDIFTVKLWRIVRVLVSKTLAKLNFYLWNLAGYNIGECLFQQIHQFSLPPFCTLYISLPRNLQQYSCFD